jgi:hypothetical protein
MEEAGEEVNISCWILRTAWSFERYSISVGTSQASFYIECRAGIKA